jgi:hypothetical protein
MSSRNLTIRERLLRGTTSAFDKLKRRIYRPAVYKCSRDLCERRFKTKVALAEHERVMHDEPARVKQTEDKRSRVYHRHCTGT